MTNDLSSWYPVDPSSDFSIHNFPFGIGLVDGKTFAVSALGNSVINLAALNKAGYFTDLSIPQTLLEVEHLNPLIQMGKEATNGIRKKLQELFALTSSPLKEASLSEILIPMNRVQMLLPVQVGDYTDFYSSEDHATNVGKMFRDPANALLPNWKHLPVGYHGRASSIVVSGTSFKRPKGQTKADDAEMPTFAPSRLLDFELEVAFIIGKSTELGETVSTDKAEDHIFGLCLFNDWSARDIQKWEYVPLGPFLGKNFASTMSPWIIALEALEPFRVPGPQQDPKVLEYLAVSGSAHYDINLEVLIQPKGGEASTVCRSNFRHMYWNMNQQLAHHTVNGCNIRVGDVMASGTISGPEESSFGSMLELSWRGTKAVKLSDGSERKFIQDHDTVIMRGFGLKNGIRVGFGEASGTVLPAS